MGKKAAKSRTKSARTKKPQASKPKASKLPLRRPKKAAVKATSPRKPAARKPKTAERRPRRAAPAAAPRRKKAAAKGQVSPPVAQVMEKRSRAVEKLLALKAKKEEPAPRKEGFLIKAPKKAKQENLVTAPRFVRRPAAQPASLTPEKPVGPPKKIVLRKKDVDELRRALEEERQRLIAQLAALDETASLTGPTDANEPVPGYSIHLAEYASENQVVETTLAQRQLQAERLAEIEEALQRINRPGFGNCRHCEGPISLKRLKVKPSAKFCVPCSQLKEQGKI